MAQESYTDHFYKTIMGLFLKLKFLLIVTEWETAWTIWQRKRKDCFRTWRLKNVLKFYIFLGELLSFVDKWQNQGQGTHIFPYQTITALKQHLSLWNNC